MPHLLLGEEMQKARRSCTGPFPLVRSKKKGTDKDRNSLLQRDENRREKGRGEIREIREVQSVEKYRPQGRGGGVGRGSPIQSHIERGGEKIPTGERAERRG